MSLITKGRISENCWFVGAMYGKSDQLERFILDGIWENGYDDKYLDLVKSIQVGDCIAIKSAYTRKHNLPFDGRGHTASVMDIKAVGIVTENIGDGRTVKVDWQRLDSPRQWYFFTGRTTIWKVSAADWQAKALISFTFESASQDIDKFRNSAYWRERFGDTEQSNPRFPWTSFYEEFADKLLKFKNNRQELIEGLRKVYANEHLLSYLTDQKEQGVPSGFLEDICPFTFIGIFNRNIKDENRIRIAKHLAAILKVSHPIPNNFNGIPLVNNQRSWFFEFAFGRKSDDIDNLWDMFEIALAFADGNEGEDVSIRSDFINMYDKVSKQRMVGWNLSIGLFWIRPWIFPPLDDNSRHAITEKLNIHFGQTGANRRCSGLEYMEIIEILTRRFNEDKFPVHSFPELSLDAWSGKKSSVIEDGPSDDPTLPLVNEIEITNLLVSPIPYKPYSIANIINDDCFFEDKLEKIIATLRSKKNIILQGVPGTGKTWLAKKLAFALMGEENEDALRVMQFHPNLSYEDFIRGWRPSGNGKLSLIDGPFMDIIDRASKNPKTEFVFVIEEINRGNPAQIFGEMLTLLEADKRTPSYALELSYRKDKDADNNECAREGERERIYIPSNVYVIGTMNIADRSIALVDLALRRRFAFFELEPTLGKVWQKFMNKKYGFDFEILQDIENKIVTLNNTISDNPHLGKQFRIGHSYIIPSESEVIEDAREWFKQVVETQICPLLDEYLFDSAKDADKMKKALLKDL